MVSADNLPQFIVDAKVAIESGRIEEARHLLNDQAIEALNEMFEDDPSRTDIMFMLGLMFGKVGLARKAEEWYRKVLQIEPNAHAFYKLGRICRSTERISEANEFAEKYFTGNPRYNDCNKDIEFFNCKVYLSF